jgi:hypothetical protein
MNEQTYQLVRAARRRLRDEPCGPLAVALHDVEPATYLRCALIRDWLADLGVERVTLLVGEADPPPALEAWLTERACAGDEVAPRAVADRGPAPRGALRVDLRPAAFDDPDNVLRLERLLRTARRRTAVTLSELRPPARPLR